MKLLLWDFFIQTETRIGHKKPGIMFTNKKDFPNNRCDMPI